MIETTYGAVRNAYAALTALSQQNISIPLGAALRWRRILGVLRPLVEQSAELEREIGQRHLAKGDDGKPIQIGEGRYQIADPDAYMADMRTMEHEPVTVGSDYVLVADFGEAATVVQSSMVGLLEALGPWLKEEAPAN